ncbi:MAG: D-glycero-beta-D-manno-heptose-7-phosphate kinase [Desulfovibrionaceae bacterium]|jgi:rfaE bifunctional protein kinase chain/domain|nr:D-glycero-beta-D-manno-heptose-7-phosphate kinase [Desulfovibrionaceae bacterium]
MIAAANPKAALLDAVGLLDAKPVLIIGDAMLDHYVEGPVERISPEAPVPVVRVARERHLLGGAGNVARNIRALGGVPRLLCISGRDEAAGRLRALIAEHDLPADVVEDPRRRTTVKTRVIAQNQQIVRIDQESPHALGRRCLDELTDRLRVLLPRHGVVILSDYGKGLISAALLKRLRAVAAELGVRPRILVDPKIRNFSLYKDVFLLTPNTKEAGEGAGLHEMRSRADVLKAGRAIFRKLHCERLLITLGAQGMALFDGPDTVWHIPTTAQEVFDVTGAGDTVIATIGLALAGGLGLATAGMLANYAAGLVVGEIGTACVRPDELRTAIETLDAPEISRWL